MQIASANFSKFEFEFLNMILSKTLDKLLTTSHVINFIRNQYIMCAFMHITESQSIVIIAGTCCFPGLHENKFMQKSFLLKAILKKRTKKSFS